MGRWTLIKDKSNQAIWEEDNGDQVAVELGAFSKRWMVSYPQRRIKRKRAYYGGEPILLKEAGHLRYVYLPEAKTVQVEGFTSRFKAARFAMSWMRKH